ncbi:Adrenodoxin-like protein 2, mitochondrial [Glycine max]|nr:Adrenodoxin-like protein 2, mitochondrial [Glycine max]
MQNSKVARVGASIVKQLCTRYIRSARYHYKQPLFQHHSFTKLYKGAMIEKHNFLSTMTTNNTTKERSEQEQAISVTFIDKDGEEKHIKVPEHVKDRLRDVEQYNKLEDPTDEENDMLDLAFGLTETSRLGCQVIAKPELDGIRLAIPAATRNFAVDGYVPKPH